MRIEYFPLMKDGRINRDLMSFSRLYIDEIVEKVMEKYTDRLIQLFIKSINEEDVQMSCEREDVEWLVGEMMRSDEAFNELYVFLSNHPSLLNKIHLRDNKVDASVVESFIKYFLRPAPDLCLDRLRSIAEDVEYDDDKEKEVYEEKADGEKEATEEDTELRQEVVPDSDDSGTELDSDDELPEGYLHKKKGGEKKEKEEGMEYKDTVLDAVAAIFDPEFAMPDLERFYSSLRDIKDPLNTPSHAASMDFHPWARAILRQLPRLPAEQEELPNFPSMIFNFAYACESGPYNRVVLMFLFPDYEFQKSARDAASKALQRPAGERVDTVAEIIKQCRPPADYVEHRRGALRDYQSTAMPINLRAYQKELVEKANMGENSVIVAPTGSGKTVVAAQIMRSHVMRRKAENKPYRMIMVVPKIPLVEQQQKQLYQYMSDVVYSTVLHGDMLFEEQGRIDKLLCSELIVMTPQILINLLESVRSKERLFVADISLLILDECHHCNSNHPYAQLMATVRAWQWERPQVVGLTASLGVGKDGTMNENSAYSYVVDLLARMTAVSLSTVVHNVAELNEHVQLPIDEINKVQPGARGEFGRAIEDFMTKITTSIRGQLKEMSRPGNNSGALIPQSLLNTTVTYSQTEQYSGRLEALRMNIKSMTDGSKKADLIMALDVLKICIMTLGMNDLLPSSIVFPQMKIEMGLLKDRSPSNPFLLSFYSETLPRLERTKEIEDDKAMLRALRKELSDQFVKNTGSKVIIFVGTRELSQCLAEYIETRKEMIGLTDGREAGFIISSKARGSGSISQTPIEQKAALDKFRANKLAVLVSTTVAEEGLDVPECNLIIKYNMTGNVISLTQQRGRARAHGSKSVLIALSQSVKKRELENASAERMMNHIVRRIHKAGGDKLKADVRAATSEMEKTLARIESEAEAKRNQLQSKRFGVVCGTCNQPLCDSTYIKNSASHHFSVDKRIWDVLEVDNEPMKSKYIDVVTTVIGKALCKGNDGKCGNDLGKVVRYHGCYMPALKCTAVQFKNKNNAEMVSRKKWADVMQDTFFIPKINDDDVSDMMGGLSEHNAVLFGTLEGRCAEICKRTRREAQKKHEKKAEMDDDSD